IPAVLIEQLRNNRIEKPAGVQGPPGVGPNLKVPDALKSDADRISDRFPPAVPGENSDAMKARAAELWRLRTEEHNRKMAGQGNPALEANLAEAERRFYAP